MIFYPCHDLFMDILHNNLPQAIAMVHGNSDHPDLKGTVRFYKTPYEGVLISAELYHLPHRMPAGIPTFYGFHIHENGDCSDQFNNTGGHLNLMGQPHPHHTGDLPPLLSTSGYAFMNVYAEQLSIPQIIGKSVIVHDNVDDFTTQPSGNSGNKIACGVITPVRRGDSTMPAPFPSVSSPSSVSSE